MTKFWKVAAQANGAGCLTIYGDICNEKWCSNDVVPQEIKKELDALGDISRLDIYINSGGGSVFAGQAIYNMLKRLTVQKTVYVDGLAASIASIIAMAGDKIVMPGNSLMMIHKPSIATRGNVDELLKDIEVLERIEDSFVEIYKAKSGQDDKAIRDMMAAEKWMSAKEAVELGFADELDESKLLAAHVDGSEININGLVASAKNYKNFPLVTMRNKVELIDDVPQDNTKSGAITADEINKFLEEVKQ